MQGVSPAKRADLYGLAACKACGSTDLKQEHMERRCLKCGWSVQGRLS